MVSEVGRGWGMNDLINTRTFECNLLVVGVTKLEEGEGVVTTTLGLNREFTSRGCERLHEFSRRLIVTFHAVVDLERCSSMEYEARRDTKITRAMK